MEILKEKIKIFVNYDTDFNSDMGVDHQRQMDTVNKHIEDDQQGC